MVEAQPEQNFDMLQYIILLTHNHGMGMSLDDRLEDVENFIKKFRNQPVSEEKMDRIRLIQADLLFGKNDLPNALSIYDQLNAKYEKAHEEARKQNPKVARSAQHWSARLGLAKCRKAMGKYNEAALDFHKIRKSVPAGGKIWWMATYSVADCMVELKLYDRALTMIRTVYESRHDLGGAALRNDFLMLLGKIASEAGGEVRKEAQELLSQIKNDDEETQ